MHPVSFLVYMRFNQRKKQYTSVSRGGAIELTTYKVKETVNNQQGQDVVCRVKR
jgi:hypothetical protein